MKKAVSFVLVAILILSLAACGSGGGEGGDAQSKDSLTVAVRTETTNFDPQNHVDYYSYITDTQIYDTLEYLSPDTGEYELKLAESIEKSADGMYAIVKLKEGVLFHNGEEMKASDVKFTYDRAINSSMFGTRVGMVKDCEIVDDYTVKINTNYPYAPMDVFLGGVYIVNEKAVNEQGDAYGNSAEGIVGTGAYKLVSWDKGQQVTLTRNDDYYGEKAFIKDVVIKTVPDNETAVMALEKGEIDYIWEIDQTQKTIIETDDNLKIDSGLLLGMELLIVNCSAPPFDDPDLRMAVAYAIDREAVADVFGTGVPTSYYLDEGSFGLAKGVTAPERDIKKAKEYLAKAGYADGLKIPFIVDEIAAPYAPVVQANLAEIGIDLEIEQLEFNTAIDKKLAGDYTIATIQILNRFRDADFYYQWYKGDSSNNLFHFKNAELDELVVEGRQVTDEAARMDIYKRVQEILRDECAVVPMCQVIQTYACNKNLEGIYVPEVMINEFRLIHWN